MTTYQVPVILAQAGNLKRFAIALGLFIGFPFFKGIHEQSWFPIKLGMTTYQVPVILAQAGILKRFAIAIGFPIKSPS
ncbi:hypothetical protein ASF92_17450 [Pedobacter sp. Leaf176]|nr:hypothetical protein ASF92_17450 [Pedobacter sp. Leaf176]